MHRSLMRPAPLCALASDAAIGKGRDLLWAVSRVSGRVRRYGDSPEETLTGRDVPLGAQFSSHWMVILTHG